MWRGWQTIEVSLIKKMKKQWFTAKGYKNAWSNIQIIMTNEALKIIKHRILWYEYWMWHE